MKRGVVLCGGESKRMGSDKGMLLIGNCTWAEHAAIKLMALHIPVVISVNKTQLPAYGCVFDWELLVVDQVAAKGPLTGLLSVHLEYPEEDLLLVACDMTEMDVTTLHVLKDDAITFPGFDYYCYIAEGFIEPLCTVYTSAILKKLYLDVQSGRLSRFSLHQLIKQGHYKTIPITDMSKFSNQNTI